MAEKRWIVAAYNRGSGNEVQHIGIFRTKKDAKWCAKHVEISSTQILVIFEAEIVETVQ